MALSRVLLRHQAGAVAATTVDFSVMIAMVSAAGAPPALATALGALSGGIVAFVLGRRWIFRATHGAPAVQARRYAAVSIGSLILNTAGVHALADLLYVQYVAARVAVAIAVSVFWNFPLQRVVVFGGHVR